VNTRDEKDKIKELFGQLDKKLFSIEELFEIYVKKYRLYFCEILLQGHYSKEQGIGQDEVIMVY